MIKRIFLAACIVFLFVNTATSQTNKVIENIIREGKSDNQVMHHLDILSNRFGGRLIGSDAYENAANWAAGEFREWGMDVIMDETGELPVGFNRGPWFGRMLSDNGMILHFATPSYTSGTKGVQRGHVLIEPKTQAAFDRMKGKLKGAWVLIGGENIGWPIDISKEADRKRDSIIALNKEIREKNRQIRKENRDAKKEKDKKELLEQVEEPALFYRQMVDAGVLGFIQKTKTPIRVLYDRKNLYDLTFDSLPEVPDIKLDEHQYAVIEQMAKERRYFQLEFDIRNHFKPGPVKYHSVIGIIPGTEYPDEYVICCAHLDAYDVATGGVDDGSGVTPVMEAARLIMKAGGKPRRTMLFILWSGEEFGLLGSSAWIQKNPDKLEKISNVFNRDGGPTVPISMSVSEEMMPDFEGLAEVISGINPDFPFEINIRKVRKKPERPWGTDSGPFAVMGVPTIGFRNADPKGYDFNYREIWHTERDTYNKSIPEYQEHAAMVYAIVSYWVANLDHLLPREGYWE